MTSTISFDIKIFPIDAGMSKAMSHSSIFLPLPPILHSFSSPLLLDFNMSHLTFLTLVPIFCASSLVYFPVFSFDNKIDLTDAGMAKAKAIRYNERKEKGEIPSKEVLANADPYRW